MAELMGCGCWCWCAWINCDLVCYVWNSPPDFSPTSFLYMSSSSSALPPYVISIRLRLTASSLTKYRLWTTLSCPPNMQKLNKLLDKTLFSFPSSVFAAALILFLSWSYNTDILLFVSPFYLIRSTGSTKLREFEGENVNKAESEQSREDV